MCISTKVDSDMRNTNRQSSLKLQDEIALGVLVVILRTRQNGVNRALRGLGIGRPFAVPRIPKGCLCSKGD